MILKYSISYKAEAITDLKEIDKWYKSISLQLNTYFQKALENAEINLCKNPFAYSTLNYGSFRRILLVRFPYKIVYYIERDKHK